MRIITDIEIGKGILKRGGVLAYPTEAVFGLGCDPFNQAAVERIIALKGRGAEKGFILLISDWPQLFPLIQPITDEQHSKLKLTWPGFTTWIFPASSAIPPWVTGGKKTLAIRMTSHPVARILCNEFPITSSSANQSGLPPIQDAELIKFQFATGIDGLLEGKLGGYLQPSKILDVETGTQLR